MDHAAFNVRTGMWLAAVAFFTEVLDWKIVRKTGDIDQLGWRAIFLAAKEGDPVILQLTEDNDWSDDPIVFENMHLGIKVQDAKAAAAEIQYHYQRVAGLTCEIKQVDDQGLKWFVLIPELFPFALELITATDTFNWRVAARDDAIGRGVAVN